MSIKINLKLIRLIVIDHILYDIHVNDRNAWCVTLIKKLTNIDDFRLEEVM